ncbi:hypothetical protein ACFL6L_00620 [candidate division KSB1 bacterium]
MKVFRYIFHKVIQTAIIILILFHNSADAQSLVQDTLLVSMGTLQKAGPLPVVIDSEVEGRIALSKLIGRYEKNRYLFIPVDLLICTEYPIANVLADSLNSFPEDPEKPRIKLSIEEFWVTKKTNSRLYPHYVLNAAVRLDHKSETGSPDSSVRMLYEITSRAPLFGDNLKKGFESVLRKWQDEFYDDLSVIADGNISHHLKNLDNFRTGEYSGRRNNMYAGIDFTAYSDGWATDYEILFSHRETKNRFIRNGYLMRYRKSEDFDAIEYGLTDDILFHRLHDSIVLRGKAQIFFGINRWNDLDESDHKIYDALLFNVSLSQSIMYNPLDKRSFTFGAGIMEDVYYIWSKDFQFRMGFMIHLGIKL